MNEAYEATKALLADMRHLIPKGRWGIRPETGVKTYRGKRQFTVGYYWSKLSGQQTYDVVLGAGETWEAAIANARAKLAKARD